MRGELGRRQIRRGEPVEESRRAQDVAVRARLDVARPERLLGEPPRGAGGEMPPLAVLVVLGRRDLRQPGHGGEQHPAGREDALERRERGADVVDELQRLGDDRAVEGVVSGCAARRSGRRRSSPAGCPRSPSGCRRARRRARTGSCSPPRRSRARARGRPPRTSRRTPRRRRGRSASRARTPSSDRSASPGEGRRASAGVGAASPRRRRGAGRSRVRTDCGT